ncbi:MAG: hypothetical protein PWR12_1479 [Eubacteriaceae bacterium]|jgi:transposase|nr:hypothetical protein [Eubacteriaceae bacterium]
MDCDGNSLKKFTVQNNPTGASFLRDQVISLADKHSCQEIHIGMESTSVYSFHPTMFLNEDEALRKYQIKVYVINATLVNKFKEAYLYLDKTDDIDAWVIADRLCFGRIPYTVIMQEQLLALQRLTRMRYRLVHNVTREKQYFLQNLFLKCNAFKSEFESSAFGNAMMELFLEQYSLEEINSMDTAVLCGFPQRKREESFPRP